MSARYEHRVCAATQTDHTQVDLLQDCGDPQLLLPIDVLDVLGRALLVSLQCIDLRSATSCLCFFESDLLLEIGDLLLHGLDPALRRWHLPCLALLQLLQERADEIQLLLIIAGKLADLAALQLEQALPQRLDVLIARSDALVEPLPPLLLKLAHLGIHSIAIFRAMPTAKGHHCSLVGSVLMTNTAWFRFARCRSQNRQNGGFDRTLLVFDIIEISSETLLEF